MKKLYFLAAFAFGLLTAVSSQELIVGGDLESDASWTLLEINAGDGHTETFGYSDDIPSGGSGGCLSLASDGNWAEVAFF